MNISTTLEPKIYVACLASYDNGRLYGKWIDANQDVEAIRQTINDMLALSPEPNAEEWAIHSYEGFGSVCISESEDIDTIASLAAFISEHGKLGAEVLGYTGGNINDATTYLEECYHGEYDSEEDFAESFYQECYDIPDHLVMYIDYEKVARDLFINDYLSIELGLKVHVFSRH